MNCFKYAGYLFFLISSCKTKENQKIEPPVSKKTRCDFTIAFGSGNYQNAVIIKKGVKIMLFMKPIPKVMGKATNLFRK